jgi:hypothetical protein
MAASVDQEFVDRCPLDRHAILAKDVRICPVRLDEVACLVEVGIAALPPVTGLDAQEVRRRMQRAQPVGLLARIDPPRTPPPPSFLPLSPPPPAPPCRASWAWPQVAAARVSPASLTKALAAQAACARPGRRPRAAASARRLRSRQLPGPSCAGPCRIRDRRDLPWARVPAARPARAVARRRSSPEYSRSAA